MVGSGAPVLLIGGDVRKVFLHLTICSLSLPDE